MSLCVIEPLLRQALLSCGRSAHELPDRWGSGSAQAGLILDAWSGTIDHCVLKMLPNYVARHLCDRVTPEGVIQPADQPLGRLELHDHGPHAPTFAVQPADRQL